MHKLNKRPKSNSDRIKELSQTNNQLFKVLAAHRSTIDALSANCDALLKMVTVLCEGRKFTRKKYDVNAVPQPLILIENDKKKVFYDGEGIYEDAVSNILLTDGSIV